MLIETVKQALREDLTTFTQKVFTTVSPAADYLHNWHIRLICKHLEACKRGEIKRLIINIPPRFMKSICASVAFPAWLLGHNPKTQVMCASFAMTLSHKHSMDTRLVVESDWYKDLFPKVKLVDDQNTKSKFVTTERGFRLATSIGSAVTGAGADFLIIDDPLNADEANSEVAINNANNWYDQVFSTRLNDPKNGCIILIMQRLHENDLTGHLLSKGGWTHLKIPLIAEHDETFTIGSYTHSRKTGELLHPSRISADQIPQMKYDMGVYAFSGQYQQQPTPEGGGKLRREWLQFYDSIEISKLNTYIFIDPAFTQAKKSDFTSISVLGFGEDKNVYLINAVRDRLDAKGREDIIFELVKQYRPIGVYLECYGGNIDDEWLRHAMNARNYRFPLFLLGGIKDKVSRIMRLEPIFARGQIWLPRSLYRTTYDDKQVDVIGEFIKEYLTFPLGLHDDMLDSMSRFCDITPQYPNQGGFDYYKFAEGFK